MKFALVENERAEATPKSRATCSACGRTLIAKCGTMVVWHWSHSPVRHCDPWWENETEWHRAWKNLFPKELQEIIHTDEVSGERHIADVKTTDSTVIEFQNSAMSPAELASRENFYKKMLWIVNAQPFKAHFHILHQLPPPESPLTSKLHILRPPRFPLKPDQTGYRPTNDPVFAMDEDITMKGEGFVAYNLGFVGVGGKRWSSTEAAQEKIADAYDGHHYLDWRRPRNVWFASSMPVYFDLGDEVLWHLQRFKDEHFSVKWLRKADFIRTHSSAFPGDA